MITITDRLTDWEIQVIEYLEDKSERLEGEYKIENIVSKEKFIAWSEATNTIRNAIILSHWSDDELKLCVCGTYHTTKEEDKYI